MVTAVQDLIELWKEIPCSTGKERAKRIIFTAKCILTCFFFPWGNLLTKLLPTTRRHAKTLFLSLRESFLLKFWAIMNNFCFVSCHHQFAFSTKFSSDSPGMMVEVHKKWFYATTHQTKGVNYFVSLLDKWFFWAPFDRRTFCWAAAFAKWFMTRILELSCKKRLPDLDFCVHPDGVNIIKRV